jgi:uncharacterized protein (DUF2235 family)
VIVPGGAAMGTRIVLLSDGTGNSAAKIWRTNVWRVFEALDLAGSDQIAIYDDGVGTSSFKPLALLGSAFGWGLKRNVIDLYKFACRNYKIGDEEIFGFGFSRGAFTIRIVIDLILNQGLVPFNTEAELDRNARAAYRAFRAENFHSVLRIEAVFRAIRDLILRSRYKQSDNRTVERIRFLGLWDTVAAYGLPVEEMTRGVSQWIWPLELPDRRLRAGVQRACHALSLDDERTTFHPVLWDESQEALPAAAAKPTTRNERISQVWFAGAHSNVGGGYPDDSLAYIPLYWVMREAEACGLRFKTPPSAEPNTVAVAKSAGDKDGRFYDPRRGAGGYYRYGPRKLDELCHMRLSRRPEDIVEIKRPKIHESVLKRIKQGAHVYAPIGLPADYDLVTDDGSILSLDNNPFETKAHAQGRSKAQETVWNIVWAKRVVYFASVGASLYLAAYPLVHALPAADELETSIRPISDLIRLVGEFIPGAFSVWINNYARDPLHFLESAAVIALLLALSSSLGARITDNMRLMWKSDNPGPLPGLLHGLVYGLRTSAQYRWAHWALKRHIAPFLFALSFVYLGLTFASHLIFNFEDSAGLICTGSSTLRQLAPQETAQVSFKTNAVCNATGINLERGVKYSITVRQTSPWSDGGISTSAAGFYSADLPWSQRLIMYLGWPLKRDFIRPWFRVIQRVGATGTYEDFLDPDVARRPTNILDEPFTPKRSGELFIYVNDAVTAIPWLQDYFYRNNSGDGTITVKRQ